MVVDDLIRLGDKPTEEQLLNAARLIAIVNEFEAKLGKSLHSNSGIRTIEHQIEIYTKLREQDVTAGKSPRNIPMNSQHLHGNAVDLSCPTMSIKDLQSWFLLDAQIELAESLGVYFESFDFTPEWVHLQDVAPHSGNRFFIP